MAKTARRYDFDLLLAADFRGADCRAETAASHLACLADGPWRIGLWSMIEPGIPRSAVLHPRIEALARAHAAVPIPPDAEGLRTRLVVIYAPHLLAPARAFRADTALIVLADLPSTKGGPAFEPGRSAAWIDGIVANRQVWCPSSAAIRNRLRELAPGLPIRERDLPPIEPIAAWRTMRRPPEGRRPILGRMLLPGDEALPGRRETMLDAYPAAPDITMRFLGGGAALSARVEPLPREWQLLATNAVTPRRFLARLDCYVQQQDDGARQPPRGALQAMAAGRVVLASPSCRAALGAGPAYRDPDQIAETARYLHAEARFYDRYVAEQDAALADRFGPNQLLDLLAEHIKVPRRRARARPAGPRPIMFYPTNGIGLGHVTRLLAIARRLPPEREAIFITPCQALAVIEHAGFRTEYIPEPAYEETDPTDHAAAMAPRLALLLHHYDPAALVFDGNVPREWLLQACAQQDLPLLWLRRGMWRADPALARHLEHASRFDAVLEPAEAAAAADRGATAAASDGPVVVPPVMLLDRGELDAPAQARAALGLVPDRPAVLVQPGAGNNHDIEPLLDRVVEAQVRLGLQVVVAEWLIQQTPLRRRGLRYLSSFPNARHFAAFDLAVSAAGYNSFHELLHHGIPTIFVPNDSQKVDDQRARAEWAEGRGAAICLPRGAEAALPGYLSAMLDPGLRRQLARRARALCPANGAAQAAAAVMTIAARG